MSRQKTVSKIMNIRDFHFWVKGLLDGTDGNLSERQWKLLVDQALDIMNKSGTSSGQDIPTMIWGFVQVNGDQYPSSEQLKVLIERCYQFIEKLPATGFDQVAEQLADRINRHNSQPKGGGVLPSDGYPLDPHYKGSM